jgi:type I restriction enzyme, R subunit
MTTVGQIEKRTQAGVVALFRERLNYDYLGDKTDLNNHNLELTLLRGWLAKQGVSETLINRALHELNKAATDTSMSFPRNFVFQEMGYNALVNWKEKGS